MALYAVVSPTGLVTNIIVWDAVSELDVSPNILVAADKNAQIGGIYQGGVFNPATLLPVPTDVFLRRLPGVFNVKSFGAIGDGDFHPLSQRFGSLAEARVFYPLAATLSEEIDYNAIKSAITAAIATVGGTIHIPLGHYNMNNIANPRCFLQIPECDFHQNIAAPQVNIKGDGWRASILKWMTDSGINGSDFAISCGNPTASVANGLGRYGNNFYEGYFEDFSIIGPKYSFTVGVKDRNLSGLAWGPRRHMRRVGCHGFYAGIDIVGDWATIEDCSFTFNYYGGKWPIRSNSLYGDVDFYNCFFTSSAMAAIAVSSGSYLQSDFYDCYVGGAPYGIMMEGSATADATIAANFYSCQYEFLGNAAIFDENSLGGGTRHLVILNSSFRNCPFLMGSLTKWTGGGRGNTALITVKQLQNVLFDSPNDLPAGADTSSDFPTRCSINANIAVGVKIEGNLSWITNDGFGPTVHFAIVTSTTTMEFVDHVAAWAGRLLQMHPSSTASRGMMLEFTSASVPTSSALSTRPMVGVAMHDATNSQKVIVATRGCRVPILNDVTNPAVGNSFCKKGPTGAVVLATSMDDGFFVGLTENTAPPYILVTLSGKYIMGLL